LTKGRIARRLVTPRGGEWIPSTLTPIYCMYHWTRMNQPPNFILIGFPFLHSSHVCPTHRNIQTYIHTDNATCDICRIYAMHAMRPTELKNYTV